MSFATLAALNIAVEIPVLADVLKDDDMLADATDAIKDKAMDQFKRHLLLCLNAEDVGQHFSNYETQYKTETGKSAMPGHYRSNKSVLLGCEKYGIPVIDADGFPRGKTELEKAIKEAKSPKTPMEKAMDALERMTKASDELDQAELDVLVNAVATVFPQLVVVRKAAA